MSLPPAVTSLGAGLSPGVRMPAETDPHERTLMVWPPDVEPCIFTPDHLDAARTDYATIVRAIAAYEPVTLVVRSGDVDSAQDLVGDAADLVEIPVDDSWMRDDGPIVVRAPDGTRTALHFRFNAWGDKQPHSADAVMGAEVARRLGLPVHEVGMVLEGGSIAIDGRGTLVTTERCLLNPNRNPELDRAGVESVLRAYLGVERIMWLADAIAEDDGTDGHVDNVVAFTPNGTALVQGCDDDGNPNAAIAADNLSRLRAAGIEVVEVPVLPYAAYAGQTLPVPYVNVYAGNGFVAVPVSGHPYDATALELVGEHYPGRAVVPVPGVVLAFGGGGVHCITQQVPR